MFFLHTSSYYVKNTRTYLSCMFERIEHIFPRKVYSGKRITNSNIFFAEEEIYRSREEIYGIRWKAHLLRPQCIFTQGKHFLQTSIKTSNMSVIGNFFHIYFTHSIQWVWNMKRTFGVWKKIVISEVIFQENWRLYIFTCAMMYSYFSLFFRYMIHKKHRTQIENIYFHTTR